MKTAAYRHPSPAFLADLNIRRERLYKLLGNKICLLQAAPIGSSSVYHRTPYKQDADFMHLTGLYEENCIALFDPNSTEKFKLFMTPVDKNSELWNGPMTSLELAVQAFGAQGCYPLSDL